MKKNVIFIIAIILLVVLIRSCSSCSSPESKNAVPVQTEYQLEKLDELIGVYNGTRATSGGPYGWQLFVFKDSAVHRAALYVYRISGSPSDLSNYSYLANINFNASSGKYEFKGYSHIAGSYSDVNFASWTGTLNNRTFSGSNGNDTFNLRKISKGDYKYTGPHNHHGADEGTITKEATCTADGEMTFFCIFCGEVITRETLPKLPHTPSGKWVVLQEPTCTEEGSQVQYCAVCNEETIKEPVPKLPHKPSGEWVVVAEPLCNEPGRRVQYCTDCGGEVVSEEIAPLTNLDHVFESSVRGNIFFPPIDTEKECTVCGVAKRDMDFTYVWVSPAILLGLFGIVLGTLKIRAKMREKFTCPYCFAVHTITDCWLKCSTDNCKFGISKDKDGWIALEYKKRCLNCKEEALFLFCNKTKEIPIEFLSMKSLPIALLGAKSSGKSHYIGVLINEIRKKMTVPFNCSLSMISNEKAYEEGYYRPLYKEGKTVLATAVDAEITPLIFSLKFMDAKSRFINKVALTFYDTAGENLDKKSEMHKYNRYISKNAHGLILLLDPLQIPKIRKELSDKDFNALPPENTEIYKVLSNIIDAIRDVKKIKGQIHIPLALVFTKIDVLEQYNILPKNSFLRNESKHIEYGAFVNSYEETTHTHIEDLIGKWLDYEIMGYIGQFKKYSFFGVSALGGNPNGTDIDGEIRPRRVLDPLLWLLAENKYIKTLKEIGEEIL
jgi:hypothetical protein